MGCSIISPNVLVKQPSERRFFGMEFAALLASGESISGTPEVTCSCADVGISGISISGTKVLFWVSSGVNNERCRMEVIINTSAGQIIEGDGILKVLD